MDADEALLAAWTVEDHAQSWTEEVMERFDPLLPTLVAAGFAETHEFEPPDPDWHTWNYTKSGIERLEQLLRQHRRRAFRCIRQLEKRPGPAMSAELAAAYLSYAEELGRAGRDAWELAAYEAVVERFRGSEAPNVQEQVTLARAASMGMLAEQERVKAAREEYRKRYPDGPPTPS